jgi:hypothetical protein
VNTTLPRRTPLGRAQPGQTSNGSPRPSPCTHGASAYLLGINAPARIRSSRDPRVHEVRRSYGSSSRSAAFEQAVEIASDVAS